MEDLTDLELVIASIAVDDHRGQVVVEDKGVVAGAAVDDDAAVDVAVVVDALDGSARNWITVLVGLDRSNHAECAVNVGSDQEVLIGVRAEHVEYVDTQRVAGGFVEHIDDGAARTGETNEVLVAAASTVQRQFTNNTITFGLHAELVVVDPKRIAVGCGVRISSDRVTEDDGVTRNRLDVEEVCTIGAIDLGAGRMGSVDMQLIVARTEVQPE